MPSILQGGPAGRETQSSPSVLSDKPPAQTDKPAEPAAPPPLPSLAPGPQKPPGPPSMRAFGDSDATRAAIYDNALKAARSIEPVSNSRYKLHLTDVGWADPDKVGL